MLRCSESHVEPMAKQILELQRQATNLRRTRDLLLPRLLSGQVALAIESLTRNRATMSLVAANREVYDLLKTGVPVSVPDREHGGQKTERLRVIDWQQPLAGNDFLLVSQMTVTGALYTVCPDLIGFVNGLPLVVVELKKPGVPAKQAFDDNLTSYKQPENGIPDLFWYNALLIASNGIESRVGTLTADWERFFEWKRIAREDEGMSRALLKLSGSLVHDYATIADDSPSPNRASRARRAATSAGIS